MRALKILRSRRRAQNYVEYGLIVAVVALVVMVGANNLSSAESAYFIATGPSLAPAPPTYTPIGLPTVVTVAPPTLTVTGTYGGTVNLTATLFSNTTPVSGKTLSFMLNGTLVCGGTTPTPCPTTDGSGLASLSNVSLTGIHAGTYTTGIVAQFQGDASYQLATGTGTLIVGKASQSITFAQPSSPQPYQGIFTVSPTASSGLPTTVSASGGCTVDSQSGSTWSIRMISSTLDCTLTASQDGNGDYLAVTPPVTRTVAATKGTATVTISGLSQTYDATPKSVSATTNPGGLATTITYNGVSTPPTNAGSYAVVATVSDPNWTGSATGTLVISKATVTLTFTSALNVTYNARPQAVTASASKTVQTIVITYSPGGATPPTNVGTYTVTASVTDPNYMGSNTGTLIVSPAPTSVLVDAKTVTSQNKTSVTLTGSVYAIGGSPVPAVNQGTFTFSFSGSNPCSGSLSPVTVTSTGAASVTCSIANPVATGNTFTIVGTYNPNTTAPINFATSATSTATAPMNAVANGSKNTNLTVLPALGSVGGGSVTLTAILTDINNNPVKSTDVTLTLGGGALCGASPGSTCTGTAATDNSGTVSIPVALRPGASGTYPIYANGGSTPLAELTVN